MGTIIGTIGSLFTGILEWVTGWLDALVANDYFLTVIVLCITTAVIGIILRFFKSFGLRRGGKRRGK